MNGDGINNADPKQPEYDIAEAHKFTVTNSTEAKKGGSKTVRSGGGGSSGGGGGGGGDCSGGGE